LKKKNNLLFFSYTVSGGQGMEKEIMSGNHIINMTNRKTINISGVKKIESFNDFEFLLETNMGYMEIKGSDLEIVKLDTYQGDVSIKGKIDSIIYNESSNKKNKEESIFSRLFK
jgi:sporulation protein YabP